MPTHNLAKLVAKTLSFKAKPETDITWTELTLNDKSVLVPNTTIFKETKFSALAGRLLPIFGSGLIKLNGKYYRATLPSRKDITSIKEFVDPNTRFWVKSLSPRMCRIGPRHGKNLSLVDNEGEGQSIGFLPILIEVTPTKEGFKGAFLALRRAVMRAYGSIKQCAIKFGKIALGFCKGLRSGHWRKAHWRKLKSGVCVWVKSCWVRSHYCGEAI